MEELKALTEKIAEDGEKPWCIGLGSGGATGWPGDRLGRDLMLRPSPRNLRQMGEERDTVHGCGRSRVRWRSSAGSRAMTPSSTRRSGGGVDRLPGQPERALQFSAECYLHHQASFIPSFFPEGKVVGEDADFFYMPPMKAKRSSAIRCSAQAPLAMITKDNAAHAPSSSFLKTPIAHEVWNGADGFLTPYKSVNVDVYGNPREEQGEILLNATTFRFDGSDLMPARSGPAPSGGMVDFVGGKSSPTSRPAVQKAWDSIK
ncbi:hypothetical protein F2981_09380 [Sinorhizobium meliloti]|nr:hypothetical protein [Sinorhizobium meliloti]